MQTGKISAINQYFDANIHMEKASEASLLSDQRQDEAVFARIRGNVYGIFSSVFHTAVTQANDPCRFFLEKLETIPANWQKALHQADSCGDWKTAHLERIKLETAKKILNDMQSILEVSHDGTRSNSAV